MPAIAMTNANNTLAHRTFTLVKGADAHHRAVTAAVPTHCGACNLREVCLPLGLLVDNLELWRPRLIVVRHRFRHRALLFSPVTATPNYSP